MPFKYVGSQFINYFFHKSERGGQMVTSCRKSVNKGKLGSYILHPNINYLTGPSYLDEAAGEK